LIEWQVEAALNRRGEGQNALKDFA